MDYFTNTDRAVSDECTLLNEDDIFVFDALSVGTAASQNRLRDQIAELGFIAVRLSRDTLALHHRCLGLSKAFFELPADQKNRLSHSSIDQRQYGNVGYFPPETEKAATASVHDIKEFFHVGPEPIKKVHPGLSWWWMKKGPAVL